VRLWAQPARKRVIGPAGNLGSAQPRMLGPRVKFRQSNGESAMEYRQLGNSGLKVSVLTMGAMTFGGKGNFAKVGNLQFDEVRKLIDIVADAGVNLIDTANVYSGGGSEELIGEAMGPKRKPGMLIATKARYPMGEGPNDRGLSRWHLIRECEASLKRLRTDVIDLYQVHQWDGLTPLEETMEALDSLVRSGKVRYVGCSNWSGWHMMKAMEVARRDGRIPFVSEQIHSSCRRAKPNTNSFPLPSIRSSLSWCGARSPEVCCPASIAATRRRRKERARWRGGKSRRCATRTRCGTSSTNCSRSPRPIVSRGRRSRWHGCSAGPG
jgi:diketogulonate reductase-like aldo/keto reductase